MNTSEAGIPRVPPPSYRPIRARISVSHTASSSGEAAGSTLLRILCASVKRWSGGQMVLRWVASALADAATRMRKLRGYAQMKFLLKALDAKAAELNDRSMPKAA